MSHENYDIKEMELQIHSTKQKITLLSHHIYWYQNDFWALYNFTVCPTDEEKTSLRVFYCGPGITRIPKCCKKDFSINQRYYNMDVKLEFIEKCGLHFLFLVELENYQAYF